MDLDRNLATHLAAWGHTRRGWDVAGCDAQLAKVKGRSADDVAMAWVRFCADDGVRSPGAFPNLAGPHWSEKVAPPATPGPPKTWEACADCGKRYDVCGCDGGPTLHVVPPPPDVHAKAQRLRAVATKRAAELCCGVPVSNCLTHRAAKTEPEESA